MSTPQDCSGSPPPESHERMPIRQQSSSRNPTTKEPKMKNFGADVATPATHTSTTTSKGNNNDSPHKKEHDNARPSSNTAPLDQPSRNNNNEEPLILQLPRSLLPHWFTLMLCSALCLAAVAAGTPLTMSSSEAQGQEASGPYDDMQIVMAIATLSLMLTFVAGACYLLIPAAFVGTLYEVTVVRPTSVYHYIKKSNCRKCLVIPKNHEKSHSCWLASSLSFLIHTVHPDWIKHCFLEWISSHYYESPK